MAKDFLVSPRLQVGGNKCRDFRFYPGKGALVPLISVYLNLSAVSPPTPAWGSLGGELTGFFQRRPDLHVRYLHPCGRKEEDTSGQLTGLRAGEPQTTACRVHCHRGTHLRTAAGSARGLTRLKAGGRDCREV